MSQERLTVEREALEQGRGRIESERREAIDLADQLSRDLDQATERFGKLEAKLRTEQDQVRALTKRMVRAEAQAEERAAHIEARTKETREARAEAAAARSSRHPPLMRGS